MDRRTFWFGYLLAIGAVLYLVGRQRQEAFHRALQRLREVGPDVAEWPVVERVQEKWAEIDRARQSAGANKQGRAAADMAADDGEAERDNLKEIMGIGPAFERRLNEAGVTRFAQLAALDEEEIRERMQLQAFQGDVASWIEQARALARRS